MKPFVAAVAATLLLAPCVACTTPGAVAGRPTTATPGAVAVSADDETLGAATAAAQRALDRFASADYAGVWQLMTQRVRDHISQEDFVSFYRACKKAGRPVGVTRVRLQGNDEAIVAMVVAGSPRVRIMAYENGRWAMEPTDDFASHLGQPVSKIIAEETADGRCNR